MKSRYHLLHRIIFFLLIILIPSVCFIFHTIHQTNQELHLQTLRSIHTTTSSYALQLDNEFTEIYHINYFLQNQSELLNFDIRRLAMSPYERGKFINNFRFQLSTFRSLSPLLESSHGYFPKLNTIYHSDSYPGGSFSTLDEEESAEMQKLFSHKKTLAYYTDPLSRQKTLSVLGAPESSFCDYRIILNLSIDALKHDLEQNCVYNEDYYYYTTDCGFTLSNLSSDQLNTVDPDELKISDSRTEWHLIDLNGQSYYVFPYQMTYSGAYFIRLISSDSILNIVPFSYMTVFFFFILLMGACIFFFINVYRMIHQPLSSMTQAFTEVENGNFQIQLAQQNNSDFSYLFHAFNRMTSNLNELVEKNYTQAILLQKAELKQLQAQINPHFLYNSFFMLQHMIRWDPPQAQEVAGALARYFQYITRNSRELVPLEAEYAHTRNYLSIQEMRFSERIVIELEKLPENYAFLQVPKLVLQPLLENTFKYGLSEKEENGLLRVTFRPDGDCLKVLVEDNGDSLSDSTLSDLSTRLWSASLPDYTGEFTGLLNIQRRLMIVSRLPHPLRAFRSELGGLGIEMTLRSSTLEENTKEEEKNHESADCR